MRSNGLLKWLMIPMALLVVFVDFKLFSGGSQPSGDSGPQLTPEEARALGIEGDTPRDTVAKLVDLVRQLRGQLQTALGDNRTQKAENERLRNHEGAIDRRIQSALEKERNLMRQDRDQVAGERQRTQGMLQDLQRRIENLKEGELPVGLGLDGESTDGVRWVEPDDARVGSAAVWPATASASRPRSARRRVSSAEIRRRAATIVPPPRAPSRFIPSRPTRR